MYKCDLNIYLVGVETEAAEAMRSVEPLEWFSHNFIAADGFAGIDVQEADVLVFKASAGAGAERVRKMAGEKAVCVICSDDASGMSCRELSAVDDVWPGRLAFDTAKLLFARLMKDIKLKKDAWLWELELQSVIDTSMDLIWFKGRYGEHWRVNDAFCKIVNKTKEDIRGKQHYYIWGLSEEEYKAGKFVCLETEQDVKEAGKTCRFREHVMGQDGLREMITLKTPLYDEKGEFLGTVGVAKDITKEEAYRKKLLHQAQTDELTGLLNRRYCFFKLEKLARCERLAICYMDLDFFKELNDRYGHQAGDDALVGFAGLLRQNFPEAMNVRMGGDEFVVVMRGEHSREGIQSQLDNFMDNVHEFFARTEEFRELSVSIGVTIGEEAGIPLEVLLHQGDIAMYEAKNGGKNRYCFYSDEMYGANR